MPGSASPKDLITVTGRFFCGPKKPVVRLAGTGKPKKAKVIGKPTVVEGNDTLLARVPKLPGGSYSALVSSKAGTGVAPDALDVIAPVPGGSKKKLSVLHAFNGGGDGKQLMSRLLLAPDGMFYGTAWTGGSEDSGTIFRISPAGAFTLLRDMTAATDGSRPQKGLTLGPDGALYGAAQLSGPLANGTIFRITTAGDFSVFHSFSPVSDGGGPVARPLLASDGNFCGTTIAGGGGPQALGTALRLTPEGEFTKLFVFRFSGEDSEFGNMVTSALVEGPDGRLYGVAEQGGAGCGICGTIFALTKEGEPELLHTFTCPDGSGLTGPLLLAADGLLYGVTGAGGPNNLGMVFGPDGALYGTSLGGSSAGNHGTVFRVKLD